MKKLATWWLTLCMALSLCACSSSNGSIRVFKDPFVGERRGFILYLDGGYYTGVGVNEAQGRYTMVVLVVQRGQSRSVAHVGDKAQFLVGDEILTLENSAEATPVTNHTAYDITTQSYNITTQWKLMFNMDRKQASRFAVAPLKAIKVIVGNQEHQLALDPDQASKVQNNLAEMTKSSPVRL